MHSEYLVK